MIRSVWSVSNKLQDIAQGGVDQLTDKKGEGKTPRTHQVMSSNPWEVVTPKMGNSGSDFGLVGSPKGSGQYVRIHKV